MSIYSNRVMVALAAGVCALAILPGSVQAQVPLSPGATQPLVLDGAPIVGGVLLAALGQSYSSAELNGTLSTWVILGNSANPLGGLTFVYQVQNTGPQAVTALELQGFSGFATDVGNNTSGDATIPLLPPLASSSSAFSATRTAAPGDVIDFSFINSQQSYFWVFPGTSSSYLVVDTAASLFAGSMAELIGNTDPTAADLIPATAPDTGSTVTLLGAALSGIAFLRRKVTR